LDEPTNHLDLATREALAMALNEFEGTVMLVSHDRSLLRAVCDEFWMVGRGKVEPFDGDLDDYQKYLLEESKRLREEAKEASTKPPEQKAPAPWAPERKQQVAAQAKPLKKTLAQTEERMGQLQTQKTALENALLTLKVTDDIVQASQDLDTVNSELEDLEIKWLDVSEQIQRIESNTATA